MQNKDYEQNLANQNFAASSNSIDTDRISAIAHRATAAMKLASAILHALVLRAAALAGTASAGLPLIVAHHFTSCLDVYLNGGDHGATAPTGTYTIYPNGGAAVDVYCDMSDTGGWTKFLQYNDMYTPNIGAVGTISGPGGVSTDSGADEADASADEADAGADIRADWRSRRRELPCLRPAVWRGPTCDRAGRHRRGHRHQDHRHRLRRLRQGYHGERDRVARSAASRTRRTFFFNGDPRLVEGVQDVEPSSKHGEAARVVSHAPSRNYCRHQGRAAADCARDRSVGLLADKAPPDAVREGTSLTLGDPTRGGRVLEHVVGVQSLDVRALLAQLGLRAGALGAAPLEGRSDRGARQAKPGAAGSPRRGARDGGGAAVRTSVKFISARC